MYLSPISAIKTIGGNKFAKRASLLLLLACGPVGFAQADAVRDARTALSQGNYNDAIATLAPVVESSPTDADARFMLGLAYAGAQKADAAIAVFRSLTRDFPELPEPHNNLAVLLAQQGNYEAARTALEGAIDTHKSYSTAYENLGDVYTVLATRSYNRVLELDKENEMVRTKLEMLDRINRATSSDTPTPSRSVTNTTVASNSSQPEGRLITPTTRSSNQNGAATNRSSTTSTSTATGTTSSTSRVITPTALASDDEQAQARRDVLRAVTRWAEAWSEQDVAGYLNSYSPNFVPEGGVALSQWQNQRRSRLQAPSSIQVRVLNPRISLLSDRLALVSFKQDYNSDNYQDEVNKTLRLERTAVGWKIVREESRP